VHGAEEGGRWKGGHHTRARGRVVACGRGGCRGGRGRAWAWYGLVMGSAMVTVVIAVVWCGGG